MSRYEDHPFIAELKRYCDDDDEATTLRAHVNFASFDPTSRTHLLIETEKTIGADDGVGLRQKAQLMALHRELKSLDSKMRATGR